MVRREREKARDLATIIDRKSLSPKVKAEPSLVRHNTLEQLQSEENDIQLRLLSEGKYTHRPLRLHCTFVESSGDHVKNGRAICSDGIDRNRNTRTPNFITGDINKQQRGGSLLEKQRKAGARTLYTSEVKNECHLRTGKTPKTNHQNTKKQYRAKTLVAEAVETYAKIPKGMNIITNTMETWEKRHRLEFGPCLQLTVRIKKMVCLCLDLVRAKST